MTISNDFLDRAIKGLRLKNVWITHGKSGFGIREKDYSCVRKIKAFAKNFGCNLYSDLKPDSLLFSLRHTNWEGIDPVKMRAFLRLFEWAIRGRHLEDNEKMVKNANKKVKEDTFLRIWSRRSDGDAILFSLPQAEIGVTLENQDFSVKGNGYGGAYIYNSLTGEGLAYIDHYRDNEDIGVTFQDGNPSFDATMLEQVLVKAYENLTQ